MKPRDAIRQLAQYEAKLNEQLEKRENLNKAKLSVKMQEPGEFIQLQNFEDFLNDSSQDKWIIMKNVYELISKN